MTEDNRKQSTTGRDPRHTPARPPVRRGANEDPEARKAFEKERLHPALRLNQEFPNVAPERRWSSAKDDATAPARPVAPMKETLTDLAPEPIVSRSPKGVRGLSLMMSLIIIFGVLILLVLVTRPFGI
jgi:hypothetical protein